MVLAVCGVLFIIYLGLKKDPEITAYLDDPGVVGTLKDQVDKGDKTEIESPLVAQAHLFALRINPPAPPKPPQPVETKPKDPVATAPIPREIPKPQPVQPPVQITTKFTLLATVMCEANPKRSMVLLRQAGNKDEWFWQGETVGQLEVEEVRDGSAVFSQSGRNKQELFVPVKDEVKSLLKNDSTVSRIPAGPGSITTQLGSAAESPVTGSPEEAASVTAGRTARIDRSREPSAASAEARQEVSDRIRRVRTIPKPPTPAEQKADLDESISTIQEIMNRDDTGLSEEQRQQDNETWKQFLEILQNEKQNIPEPEKAEEPANAQEETPQVDDEGPSETETSPRDPNEE